MIPEHTCWEWSAGKSDWGYGSIHNGVTSVHSHRVSWELHFGKIPKNMHVCHMCDNPGCVRPEHLFLGTAKDNAADMCSKGRHPNQLKTKCKNGHKYTEDNTYRSPRGDRRCRSCAGIADTIRYKTKISKYFSL